MLCLKKTRLDLLQTAGFAGALGVVAVTGVAEAAGVEDTVGGTIGLGRAAYFARVNDFMATWQNPANLAVIPGGDLGGELRLPLLTSCFDREVDPNVEYKQPGVYEGFRGTEFFGKVCNDAPPGPTGNLGWAQSLSKGWGYGLGLFTPAGVGGSKYGQDTIVSFFPSDQEMYQPTLEGVEYPTRQMGLERSAISAYLMLGVGAQPIKQLRIGVSAGWGFASVYNKSVVSVLGGTFRDQEVINEIRATDWAIPRITSGVVYSPVDYLDLFAVAVYQGDIDAKGTATLTANGIQGAPLKSCSDPMPGTHCSIDNVRLQVPFQSLETTFGMRFVLPRNPRERVLDPMKDEILDLEVDVSFAKTSDVKQYEVTLHDKTPQDPDVPKIQFGNAEGVSVSYPRATTIIPKNWKDTWTIKAGGDVNVMPGVLALRAGVSYATNAVPIEYMNIDYWPVQKLGVHVGATVALGRFKLSVAYAHLFYQPVEVAVGTGGVKDIASVDEAAANAVNEGSYTAGLDVISGQLNTKF